MEGRHRNSKGLKEYLLEFIMIFLAVTIGFFAENLREAYGEDEREVKFVQSLIQELRTDSANLQTYIQVRKEKRVMMDSLVMLLATNLHTRLGNSTYYFARHVYKGSPFVSRDGTMQQLKNAGNLRLIKNENVINRILDYDAAVRDLKEWDESDNRMRTTFREVGGSVFNAQLLYKTLDTTFTYIRPTTNPQLVTDNLIAINGVAFQVQYVAVSTLSNARRAKTLKTKAEALMDLLRKEYR